MTVLLSCPFLFISLTILELYSPSAAEEKAYKKIPVINRFKDSEGNDIMLQQIQRNYDQIKADAQAIINDEMERIKSDPELCERLGIESAEEEKRKAE